IAAASLSAALLLGISLAACLQIRARPFLLTGWLWFAASLSPTIISMKDVAWAERFVYVPIVGIFIMASWALPSPAKLNQAQRRCISFAIAGVIGYFASLTFLRAQCWKNSITLYRHALSVDAHSPLLQNNLALALMQADQNEEARAHFEEA